MRRQLPSFLRDLFNLSAQPVFLVNTRERSLLDWNIPFVDMFGTGQLPLNSSFDQIFCATFQQIFFDACSVFRPEQEDEENWLSVSAVFKQDDAEPVELRILFIDAEKDLAVAVLRRKYGWLSNIRERDIQAAFDAFPAGISLKDEKGCFLACNEGTAMFYKHPRLKILGKTVRDFLSEESAQRVQGIKDWVYKVNRGTINELKVSKPSGDTWIRTIVEPVRRADDSIRGFLTLSQDISKNYLLEATLQKRDILLQAVSKIAQLLLLNDSVLDASIHQVLEILGRAGSVDRVCIWQLHPDRTQGKDGLCSSQIYEWPHETTSSQYLENFCTNIPVQGAVARWLEEFKKGFCINALVKDLTEVEQAYLKNRNVASILVAPIMLHGIPWGYIRFDSDRAERIWSASEEGIVRATGTLIGTAIQKQRMDGEILEYRRRLRDIEEATGELIWSLDSRGCFSYISENSLGMTGYRPEELLGHPLAFLIVESLDLPLTHKRGASSIFRNIEHRITCKDGSIRWARSSGKLLYGASGSLSEIHGNSLDITEIRETAENLKKTTEALASTNHQLAQAVDVASQLTAQAQKASTAKSEFLANMDHEIRTPINAIMGMLHLVAQTELTLRQRSYIEKADTACQALLQIVNNILDFSKSETGKLEMENVEFRLEDILRGVSASLSSEAYQKGLKVLLSVQPDIPENLIGDPLHLNQVLTNLVGNAIKFTEKGEVSVSVSIESERKDRVSLLFAVQDSGIGMSEEQLLKVFSAFVQGDGSATRRYGGTGLGLALCKSLVDLMGGRIWCESVPSVGTTVYFSVKFGCQALPSRYRGWHTALSDLRILVVDDNAVVRQSIDELLFSLGCRAVDAVASGEEALDALKRSARTQLFDLVLMDWKMPGMNGVEVRRRARSLLKHDAPPVVMMTTVYDCQEQMEQGPLDGPAFIVQKPLTQSVLYLHLSEILKDKICADDPASWEAGGESEAAGLTVLALQKDDTEKRLLQNTLSQAGLVVVFGETEEEALKALEHQAVDLVLIDAETMAEINVQAIVRSIRARYATTRLPIIAMTEAGLPKVWPSDVGGGVNDTITRPINMAELMDCLGRWNAQKSAAVTMVESFSGRSEEGALLPALEGVNLSAGLVRVSGNDRLYRSLLIKARDSLPQMFSQMQNAIQAGNRQDAKRFLQTLTGLLGNLGAETAHHHAQDVEVLLKEDASADVSYQIGALSNSIEALVQSLQKAFPEVSDPIEKESEIAAVSLTDPQYLLALLAELSEHAKACKPIPCKRMMEDLHKAVWPEKCVPLFKELDTQIRRYQFLPAVDVIEKLSACLVDIK